MNERLFQQIEVWILDQIIVLLSEQCNIRRAINDLVRTIEQRPLFISGLVLGCGVIGAMSGFLLFVLTSQLR